MNETIRSLIDRHAGKHSDRVFLIDPDANLVMTFGDLQQRCRQFTVYARSMGLSPNSRIAYMLDNGYWSVVVMLGTMYSGCITVPLNVVASERNLSYAMERSAPALTFVQDRHRDLFEATRMDPPTSVEHVDPVAGFPLPQVPGESISQIEAENTGMVLFTSGTTSLPKGAQLSHRNLVAGGRNVELAHSIRSDDRALCVLPLYHINGQVVTVIAPLLTASSVVMPHKFSTANFWPLVQEHRCTWISVVPTIAKFLLDAACKAPAIAEQVRSFDHLRLARSASSAMPAGMHRDFETAFGIPMIETMGLTESAAPILSNPMPPKERISGSVGLAFGDEVKVVDESFRTVPSNTIGEIVARGDNVISQYYQDPAATREAFTPDGWFRTGDLGYCDTDGYHFVTGRRKELIIKGGENIAPREIDDVLYHHDAVLEAAAFGLPDDTYGQVVAVGVVLKPGAACTVEQLMVYCREHLSEFRLPSEIILVDELPKGPSGKIQRLEFAKQIITSRSGAT